MVFQFTALPRGPLAIIMACGDEAPGAQGPLGGQELPHCLDRFLKGRPVVTVGLART